ncbi:MAG: hypothetical protein U0934_17270 [Pseudotabrizicola sp.]|jgi:hypothetical protein|uniref:hypothetical protein n=1 Tax=Pseudotabrizicola sp. TaxID=2939647 RepID=UPI0027213E6D|nr:hypothetical protein [Pseudotabrizicola sp.]MDO8882284.1 hypothetical protein [Pseudotabrizicola sp.]MDP2079937.1 hypothetical protein [Pseudotabrizicola sp.]MDZ7575676.1 hypothetical protein [Pseudotabrizicola sp.]
MTDPLAIPVGPERSVWVFAIDLPEDEAASFAGDPLSDALGADILDPTQIELIDADTFTEYGLSRYLAEGQGIAEDSLAPDTTTLNALRGPLLLVFRPALGQGRLSPRAPLRLIGRYFEVPSPARTGMTGYDAAADTINLPMKKRPSDAAMSGRVATVVLILLAIFVALFIWGAG